jgi:BirA family biotin operon repressor/biotin-[acetyl-CoA-carboxylase] ligase
MPLDVARVRARLPGREIVWRETVASTMTEAAQHPAGAVVVAEEQTAGQGRHGRIWHSEAGTGLYVSIVLEPDFPQESLQTLTLALGVAVREAILLSTGIDGDLKWPNDVLVSGKKCAGILVQKTAAAVIAGIGVNVNQIAFPAELEASATSLRLVSGEVQSREDLLASLVESVGKYTRLLVERGDAPILNLYAKKGKFVTVPVLGE